MLDSSLEDRVRGYAILWGIRVDLKTPLGFGQDGKVWKSNRRTAVKVFDRRKAYENEALHYLDAKPGNIMFSDDSN